MSFFEISNDLVENVTISLTPTSKFISGSGIGVTGSAQLMPIKSKRIKEVRLILAKAFEDGTSIDIADYQSNTSPAFNFTDAYVISNIVNVSEAAKSDIGTFGETYLNDRLERYLSASEDATTDIKYNKSVPISRIVQPTTFATASVAKRHIKNLLMPYYRHEFDDCGFYYRNYHTLNFFTGSNFNTGSALIYPNKGEYYDENDSKAFSLQFWINPRYKNNSNNFRAGTIFHLSSSLAVSLISGSQKDLNGKVSSYKILTQFSQSADISPSLIDFNSRNFPNDLWSTSSFELKYNNWHHVTVRWGGEFNNNYTGSIVIDGNELEFNINSGSLAHSKGNNNVPICIGNHYKGNNTNLANISAFSNYDHDSVAFENPLNAEIHEIKFYNSYINNNYIVNSGSGVTESDITNHSLKFYLPPYFYPETLKREMLYAPKFKVTTSSFSPTNSLFAFASDGKEVNIENFTQEMIKKHQPAHFRLTSSVASIQDVDLFMFNGENAKRNLTILPNDNGLFSPKYDIIKRNVTGSALEEHYTGEAFNDTIENYDLIKLENILGKIAENAVSDYSINHGNLSDDIFGTVNGNITLYSDQATINLQNAILDDTRNDIFMAVANELKEDSSNFVTIFNISNLYYGNRIKPGSFNIIDESLTGSQGTISMNLKDNERGGLYRADSLTQHADWNIVGNIFYDEGLVFLKSPHMSLFGKDKFETHFKGEQNIHSLVINAPVQRGYFDKSVNSSFVSLPKSTNLNDEETESIFASGINIHDNNFNIIMRANFAQPIIKDSSDEFIIRLKMDF